MSGHFFLILLSWCIKFTSPRNNLITVTVPWHQRSTAQPQTSTEPPKKILSIQNHWPKFPRFNGRKIKCGMDAASNDSVKLGIDSVETYPWLGRLFYPFDDLKLTTTVVSVTKELVIGSAFEIDKYPKTDFRAKAKVVLGSNCNGHQFGILDYVYHPEYKNQTYSALALIQLDLENVSIELHPHPICVPAKEISSDEFYAFTLSKSCKDTSVRVYRMEYVDPEECRMFYRRSGLDLQDLWPTHTACARAAAERPCVWRSGAVLALREKGRWRMAGLGVYGPGCSTPSRFLDYGMHRAWVSKNVVRMGTTAVTRVAGNHIILRQSMKRLGGHLDHVRIHMRDSKWPSMFLNYETSQLQRFGPCDPEEKQYEIFTEDTDISASYEFYYNLTLFSAVDYNCIILKVENLIKDVDYPPPKIKLKRWCVTSDTPACESSHWQLQKMDFAVHIFFLGKVHFKVNAYGRPSKRVDRKTYVKYMNGLKSYPDINWAQAPMFPKLNLTIPFEYMRYIRPG